MASIDISETRGVRYLHFGSTWIQGAMRIARPWSLELEYTREMMLPLLLRPDMAWPRTVLQVGLGAASLTRFLFRHRPEAKLTVVEIDAKVVAAARQFFKLPEDPARLSITIGDGHDYLAAQRKPFDLILVDGYDEKGRSGALDTLPFYVNARARLAKDGMVALNLLTRTRGVTASVERLAEAFDGRVLVLPPCEAGNTIAIATAGGKIDMTFEDLRAAAETLKAQTGLNLQPTMARLAGERGGSRLAF